MGTQGINRNKKHKSMEGIAMKRFKGIIRCLSVVAVFMLIALPVVAAEPAATQKQEPAKAVAAPAKNAPGLEGQININTATAEQLVHLPGIGKKTADAIIEYRTKNGNFKAVEDIAKVKGIGPKKLEKMKSYLVLEGETTLKKN
jgi:competence protein ComEA